MTQSPSDSSPLVTPPEPLVVETPESEDTDHIRNVDITTTTTTATIDFSAVDMASELLVALVDRDGTPMDVELTHQGGDRYRVEATGLTPNTVYDFVVEGGSLSGDNVTYSTWLVTEGYPVRIILKDGLDVIGDAELHFLMDARKSVLRTNSDGAVDLLLGTGELVVTYDDGTPVSQSFTVLEVEPDEDGTIAVQEFTLDIQQVASAGGTSSGMIMAIAMLAFAAIAALIGFLLWRRRRQQSSSDTYVPLTGVYDVAPAPALVPPPPPPPPMPMGDPALMGQAMAAGQPMPAVAPEMPSMPAPAPVAAPMQQHQHRSHASSGPRPNNLGMIDDTDDMFEEARKNRMFENLK